MSSSASSPFLTNFCWTALRLVAAFLFFASGTTKIFGFPVALPPEHQVTLWSQAWFGGWLEIVCGTLIGIGLLTRPAAFLMSGMMAVAYFQFHAAGSNWLWPTANGGTAAVLFCFLWLYFAAVGAGPWSADAKLRRT